MPPSLRCLIGAVLLFASAAGCTTTYMGNAFDGDLPPSQAATLTIAPEVRFVSIDGRSVSGIPHELGDGQRSARSFEDRRVVRISRGYHRIVAGYAAFMENTTHFDPLGGTTYGVRTYVGSRENDDIEFTAEPGRAYVLRLKLRPDAWGDPKEWAAQVTERPNGPIVSRTIQRIPNAPPPPP